MRALQFNRNQDSEMVYADTTYLIRDLCGLPLLLPPAAGCSRACQHSTCRRTLALLCARRRERPVFTCLTPLSALQQVPQQGGLPGRDGPQHGHHQHSRQVDAPYLASRPSTQDAPGLQAGVHSCQHAAQRRHCRPCAPHRQLASLVPCFGGWVIFLEGAAEPQLSKLELEPEAKACFCLTSRSFQDRRLLCWGRSTTASRS